MTISRIQCWLDQRMSKCDTRVEESDIGRDLSGIRFIMGSAKHILNPLGLLFGFQPFNEIDWHSWWGHGTDGASSNGGCGHLIRGSFDQNNRVFRKLQTVRIYGHPLMHSRGHEIIDLGGLQPHFPRDGVGGLWKRLFGVSPQIPQFDLSKHTDTVCKISVVGIPNPILVWWPKLTRKLVQLSFEVLKPTTCTICLDDGTSCNLLVDVSILSGK